jgi:hypothetical protein
MEQGADVGISSQAVSVSTYRGSGAAVHGGHSLFASGGDRGARADGGPPPRLLRGVLVAGMGRRCEEAIFGERKQAQVGASG